MRKAIAYQITKLRRHGQSLCCDQQHNANRSADRCIHPDSRQPRAARIEEWRLSPTRFLRWCVTIASVSNNSLTLAPQWATKNFLHSIFCPPLALLWSKVAAVLKKHIPWPSLLHRLVDITGPNRGLKRSESDEELSAMRLLPFWFPLHDAHCHWSRVEWWGKRRWAGQRSPRALPLKLFAAIYRLPQMTIELPVDSCQPTFL